MDAAHVARLFDANAPHYDRVNSLVTFGMDSWWRDWAAREAVPRPGALVLDAFTGTGQLALAAGKRGAEVVAVDISEHMLTRTMVRAARRHLSVAVRRLDLTHDELPWEEGSFDGLTIGFGLRYVDDPAALLRRLRPMLSPGARLVLLEVVRPSGGPLSGPAEKYFFEVIPRLGRLMTRQAELYQTLASSVREIGHAENVLSFVRDAGYRVINVKTLGAGLVTGIVAVTPPI